MDNPNGIPVSGQDLHQRRRISNIDRVKYRLDPCNGGDAVKDSDIRIGQVVQDHHIISRLLQVDHGVRTDIPGPAGDNDLP